MKRIQSFLIVLIGLVVICYGVTFVPATDETVIPEGSAATMSPSPAVSSLDQEICQVINELQEAQLIHALNLPEERADAVLTSLQNAHQIQQAYLFSRSDIEQQLEVLLQYPQPDQTKIQQVLQELEAVKIQYYHQVLQAEQTLWDLLSPEERARYILFQRHFAQQLQDIIINIREQRSQPRHQSDFLLRRHDEESVIRQPR